MTFGSIGMRGVPANYGGFETSPRSWRRPGREGPRGDGVLPPGKCQMVIRRSTRALEPVYRPFIDSKSLGTLSHTAQRLFTPSARTSTY